MTTQLLTPPMERTGSTPGQAPAAPRGFRPTSRRRARICVGVVIAALAVGGNLLVYSSLDHKTEVLQVVRDIPAGELVAASDLRVVTVDVDATVPTVTADDIASVVNQYARVHIAAGTLMVGVLVQPTPLVTDGQGVVAVEIRPSQIPAGLRERSRVMLVTVNRDGRANSHQILADFMIDSALDMVLRGAKMRQCEVCGHWFELQRNTARVCSAACHVRKATEGKRDGAHQQA